MNKELIIFNPSIEDGGVEKNLFLITNFLAAKNIKILVITADKSRKKEFSNNIKFIYPKNINFDGTKRYKKYFFCLLLLAKQLLFNKKKYIFSFQANIYCIVIAKLLGAKIIVRMNTAPQGWDHNFIKNKIYKYFIKKANGIIVNSQFFKNEVKKRYNVNSKFINNPFDFKKIKKLSDKKVKYFYPKKILKLITVGRIAEQKDQITILKSLKILKNNNIKFKLLLVGKGYLKNDLLSYVRDNNLKDYVEFINFQKNPFCIIKQADIFILSSLYEGSPNVLVEALYLNKKVISTNCYTGPKEILKNQKYGDLFKIKDYKDLAKKIIDVRKKNKKIIPKSFLLKFDKDIVCTEYLRYINNIFNLK